MPFALSRTRIPSLTRRHRRVGTRFAWGFFVCVLSSLNGCFEAPWDHVSGGDPIAAQEQRTERVIVVEDARLSTWEDKRPSGSIIRHGMLVVRTARIPDARDLRSARLEVISEGAELRTKIADITSDRIPVGPKMTTHFALGRSIPVRIERVDPAGNRTRLASGNVAFLEYKP
ncbi:MAG: hypothetical protein QM516_11380 [Limnohabitans sp.]|nr:hypothetical protein [Limnohabitans sp.]